MAVMTVDFLQDGAPAVTVVTDKVIETVVRVTSPTTSISSVFTPAVEVLSQTFIPNVVVSATAPPVPYEGQIWIDIS